MQTRGCRNNGCMHEGGMDEGDRVGMDTHSLQGCSLDTGDVNRNGGAWRGIRWARGISGISGWRGSVRGLETRLWTLHRTMLHEAGIQGRLRMKHSSTAREVGCFAHQQWREGSVFILTTGRLRSDIPILGESSGDRLHDGSMEGWRGGGQKAWRYSK